MLNLTKQITRFYREELKDFDIKSLKIVFCPFKNLRHKIKVEEGHVNVMLADAIKDAPLEVHQALAKILVAKLVKKKIKPEDKRIYFDFVRTSKNVHAHLAQRIDAQPKGKYHDLKKIFDRLNKSFFEGKLTEPILSWSKRKNYRKLGHYNPFQKSIFISCLLDDAKVPTYVLEFLMYHEMLHIKHPCLDRNGRLVTHTPEFRKEEKKFPYFEQAIKWLKMHENWLRQRAK